MLNERRHLQGHAAGRFMGDFNTLTDVSKHCRAAPRHIARANGREADGARDAFASVAFTTGPRSP